MFKKIVLPLLFSLFSVASHADIEVEFDLFQYGDNYQSWIGMSAGDTFGFVFDVNTDFNNIADSDLTSFFYVINNVRYDAISPRNGRATTFTSRFTFDGTNLFYHDVFNAPAEGNSFGSNDWVWLRTDNRSTGGVSSSEEMWFASGVDTTFYVANVGQSRNHVLGRGRNDIYTSLNSPVASSGTADVGAPVLSLLPIFALGLLRLRRQR